MLALLAAAALAAAPQATPAPAQTRVFVVNPDTVVLPGERGFWRGRAACPGGAMIQTSYDPALLLRPEDRAAATPKKLGHLPPGQACLLGGEAETGRSRR